MPIYAYTSKEYAIVCKKLAENILPYIGHEIRTPLSIITAALDRIEQLNIDDEVKEACTKLLAISSRIQDLQILTKNITHVHSTLQIDLRLMIFGIIDDMGMSGKKEIQQVILSEVPLGLLGDVGKVYTLLNNIVSISYGYSEPHNTHIFIYVKQQSEDDCHVGFHVKSVGVQNISPGKLRTTSNAFFEMGNLKSGAISFMICERVAQALNTSLELKLSDSCLDIEFVLVLKADKSKLEPKKKRICDFRVLIVDDNKVLCVILAGILAKFSISSDIAEGGSQAVQKSFSQVYDLIFMDCNMPQMDGYEATKQIRSDINRQSIIIALTADASSKAKERCIKAGMNDYFIKPINLKTIKYMLEKWFDLELQTSNS
jgi:CheY-like chemotaxis protein